MHLFFQFMIYTYFKENWYKEKKCYNIERHSQILN